MKQLEDYEWRDLRKELEVELNRQESIHGIQIHNWELWLTILIEEIGEIAKAILECGNRKEEILHSIAVLIQMYKKTIS